MTSPHPDVTSGGGNPESAGASAYVTAQDGLRLHVREYGPRIAPAMPVVCLPGLARTVADFDALAPTLANGYPPRRVIAINSRGRGRSDYDINPENYNMAVELGDIVTVLTALEIGKAVFIGSSRGGLLTMLLGVAHPTAIGGAVLHDIGPVIEPRGLARIKSYVGKLAQPRSFEEGAEILRRLFDVQFPKLPPSNGSRPHTALGSGMAGTSRRPTISGWRARLPNSTLSGRCRRCGTNSTLCRTFQFWSSAVPTPTFFRPPR